MATLPAATVTLSTEAGPAANGSGFCVVAGCVGTNADTTVRVFSSAKSLIAQHGYSAAVDYAALHIEATKKPVIFIGLPITTAGALSRANSVGVTGTSAITVAAASGGYMDEAELVVTCTTGGTIGTNGIALTISCDGGLTEKPVKLGTATSYTVPYLGIVISFAAGTLVAGDVYTAKISAPMWGASDMTNVRNELASQQKQARSWMVIGDVTNSTFAGYVATAINAYETANNRFALARANVRDRLPLASLSRAIVRMSGTPTLTFAEVGATGDTITRSAGSFISDGFVAGMAVTVSGSASNNFTNARITNVTATVLTLDTQDLVAEGPVAGCSVSGSTGITFAEVGATADTITLSGGGNFLTDGFAVGDIVTIAGSTSNNVTTDAITGLTATVMTLNTTDLTAEFNGAAAVSITKGETMAAWVASMDAAFASVDAKKRLSLGLGRLRRQSPITGWSPRRPVSWAASIREYQKDIHITTWRVDDGPLDGWSMLDGDGNVVEFDERTDGGGLAGRFTVATTQANGPNGAFIATDLTRDIDSSLLSYTHNMHVANLVQTVVQAATTRFIGKTPPLNADGTMRSAARRKLESIVNSDLNNSVMREFVPGEGARASKAVWTMSPDDVLNVVGATITGACDCRVNGTIVNVNTSVRVS